MLNYEKAIADDATMLTQTANNSKQYWNYSDEQMLLWKEDLKVDADYISNNIVYKAFNENSFIGFYALRFDMQKKCYEVDHFWLTTDNINKGFGRQIFENIVSQLKLLDQTKFFLIAEPNAIGFYQKMNGKKIESIESKIFGRTLDIYEFMVN